MKNFSDETELEEYLRGGSALSRAYLEAGREQPATGIDERVIRGARDGLQESRPRDRRWRIPLSAAALMLLSFGLVLRLTTEPVDPVPREMKSASPESTPEVALRRLPDGARTEKARAVEAAGSTKVAVDVASGEVTGDCAGTRSLAAPKAGDDSPEDRLAVVRCLRDAGEAAAAQHEIARLRAAYPQHRLPEDLRDLERSSPQ